MDLGNRHRLLIALALAAAGVTPPAAAQARVDSLPAGVTAKQVEDGKKLFGGAGLCLACHGPEARGGIGPDLTSGAWLHPTGSYQDLVHLITAGVPLEESKSGQMMPARGGGALSEAEIRSVAAYVWSISRRKTAP